LPLLSRAHFRSTHSHPYYKRAHDALAPKFAEALAPALATALGDFFSRKQPAAETESMEAAQKQTKK
jgi:hypothetical protein